MPDHQILSWFEALLHDEIAIEERDEIEARLASSSRGKRLLEAYAWLTAPEAKTPRADLSREVLHGLPDFGSPRSYAKLAAIVFEAWSDPGFRAELRATPRESIGRKGLELPDAISVSIVEPQQARLPSGNRIFIPLPDADAGPIAEARARRRLDATEFAWLWGPPWDRSPAETRTEAASTEAQRAPFWTTLHRLFAPRPVAFVLGALLLLTAGLRFMATPFSDGSLSGSAVGSPEAFVPALLLLLGLGLIAFATIARGG